MFPILQIGPFALQTPGLILLIGAWAGLSLAERYANRFKVNPNHLYNLAFFALIAGILGGRISYVVRFPDAFAASPTSLFSINIALLDPIGGITIGISAAALYANRTRLPFWQTLDALTPTLAILAIAIGLSHLASGSAYGAISVVPWAIEIWGTDRHPSQIYEILSGLIILWLVWPGIKRSWFESPGGRFLTFLALTSGSRLFLEAFRGDSVFLPNGWRVAQIFAWIVLAVSLWGFYRLPREERLNPQ